PPLLPPCFHYLLADRRRGSRVRLLSSVAAARAGSVPPGPGKRRAGGEALPGASRCAARPAAAPFSLQHLEHDLGVHSRATQRGGHGSRSPPRSPAATVTRTFRPE